MDRKKQNVGDIITPKDVEEQIITTDFSDEMRSSYLDYAVSVIAGRALADVRDGLKPVHRRILYAMDELKLGPGTAFKKSARIVGDAMGKYHPHGDSSIYGGLVTMSKEWMYPYPLVDGHGNFGSIEGDGAAAMRYTEARLPEITKKYFFDDINRDTVDFIPNFDETEKEPILLPVKIPNLLISGTEGIACGMAASIPSHNAAEAIDAVIAYMNNEAITIPELMRVIPGPDFATGGIIANKKDLQSIYEKGSGKIKIRGKVHEEQGKGGKPLIVITEIPQTMVGAIDRFMESVADLVRTKKAPDITDIMNASSKAGIRIVIELKKGANVQKNINLLYKKTKLEDTFGVNLLAVKDSVPKVYTLKELIEEFVSFQYEIYTRKYKYLLQKEEIVKEVKEGLIKACDCIDLIIEILRGSRIKANVRECLMTGNTDGINFRTKKAKADAEKLCFTERQTDAILSMQLQSLIGMELEALRKEYEESNAKIREYMRLLNFDGCMKEKIMEDLKAARKELKKERKTELIDADEIVLEKEEVKAEPCVALIDRFGYLKLVDESTYERNLESVKKDYRHVIQTTTTDKLYLFTDIGTKHQIRCQDIPMLKYKDKGVPLENLSGYSSAENLVFLSTESAAEEEKLFFLSQGGFCKIVAGKEFITARKTIDATKLSEGDKLFKVIPVKENTDVFIITEGSIGLHFKVSDVPESKKNSVGAIAMKLKKNDKIADVILGTEETIYDRGENLQIPIGNIKLQKRAASGVKL